LQQTAGTMTETKEPPLKIRDEEEQNQLSLNHKGGHA
jgi:hypothetical protein